MIEQALLQEEIPKEEAPAMEPEVLLSLSPKAFAARLSVLDNAALTRWRDEITTDIRAINPHAVEGMVEDESYGVTEQRIEEKEELIKLRNRINRLLRSREVKEEPVEAAAPVGLELPPEDYDPRLLSAEEVKTKKQELKKFVAEAQAAERTDLAQAASKMIRRLVAREVALKKEAIAGKVEELKEIPRPVEVPTPTRTERPKLTPEDYRRIVEGAFKSANLSTPSSVESSAARLVNQPAEKPGFFQRLKNWFRKK